MVPAWLKVVLTALSWCLVLGLFVLGGAHGAGVGLCSQHLPFIEEAVVPEGFCAFKWAGDLHRPRAVRFVSNGDAIVIEAGRTGTISVLWDDDQDGVSSNRERAILAVDATMSPLNHGLVVDERNSYIYASNSKEVWRWPYTPGQRTRLERPTLVISHIPCCGHMTRTLEMDDEGNLYVSVGSLKNVDKDDASAMIRRFIQPANITRTVGWETGEIWARGLRNEVGMRFDHASPRRLWGVENGVDNIQRRDMGDVHHDNPSEEVNLFDKPGAFYGYPYCWSEYDLSKSDLPSTARPHARGTQWLHPSFDRDNRFSDTWCNNSENVVKPAYNLHAHTAPLDIVFYNGTHFPSSYKGDAFISLHGSWNRPQPVGYNVVRLVMNKTTGMPEHELPFFSPREPEGKRHDGHEDDEGEDPYPPVPGWWDIRPVSLDFGPCGSEGECLFITSDKNGLIIAVAYGGL